MPEPSARRWPPLAAALALAAAVAALAYVQAAKLDYDFHHFYRDGRYAWEHGELNPDRDNPDRLARRQLPFYLPAVTLMIAPLTAFGVKPAAVMWAAMQAASLLAALWALTRWGLVNSTEPSRDRKGAGSDPSRDRQGASSDPSRDREGAGSAAGSLPPDTGADAVRAVAVACVVAAPAIYEAARFNQLSFLVLALALLAMRAIESRRPIVGGGLIGLAAVIKLLPALLIVWLLLKRRWAAASAAVVTALVLAVVPCLLVFGAARTREYHLAWAGENLAGAVSRGLVDPSLREHFLDYRNQSIPAVLTRVLCPQHPFRAPAQPFALDVRDALWLARGVTLALAAMLLYAARRPWAESDDDRRRCELAAFLIAMSLLGPLVRQYYLVWALPALVCFAAAAVGTWSGRAENPLPDGRGSAGARHAESENPLPDGRGSARRVDVRPGRRRWWALIGLTVWVAGMLAWLSPLARVYGAHLLMLIALTAVLLSPRGVRAARRATAVHD